MSSSYTPLDAEAWRESDFRGNHYLFDVPKEGSEGYSAYGVPGRLHDTPRFENDTISSIKIPPMTSFNAYDSADSTPVELVNNSNKYITFNKSDLQSKSIHDNISYVNTKPIGNFKKRLATCCVKNAIGDECKVKEGEITKSTGRCEDIVKDYCNDVAANIAAKQAAGLVVSEDDYDNNICGCYNIPPEVQKKFDELFAGVTEPPTCWYSKCVGASYQPPNWKTHQCRDLKICNQLAGKVDVTDFAKLNKAEIGRMSCSIGADTGTSSMTTPTTSTTTPTSSNISNSSDTSNTSNTLMIMGIILVVFIILIVIIAITVSVRGGGGHDGVLFENDIVNML